MITRTIEAPSVAAAADHLQHMPPEDGAHVRVVFTEHGAPWAEMVTQQDTGSFRSVMPSYSGGIVPSGRRRGECGVMWWSNRPADAQRAARLVVERARRLYR